MSETGVSVRNLRCEYGPNPLGIDVRRPRLSWQLRAERRHVRQTAYQVRVREEAGELWDSGRVESDQSIHVPYGGAALRSRQRCTWYVRVWDEQKQLSRWSDTAWWEMGLLEPSDWQAQWIEPEVEVDAEAFKPCPYLRRTFELEGEVESARLYATAHGCYNVHLNGQRIGDRMFAPGYTSYHERLQYQAYDIGQVLQPGENAIGALLSDGWWRGKGSVASLRNSYGDKLALLAQLHITYDDGSEQVLISDGQWRTATGPILKSDWKDGEVYDARREMDGWNTATFDDSAWREVQVADFGYDNLVTQVGPPVRKKEELAPVEILTTPAGQTVVDFGQNIAGFVRLKVLATLQ